MPNLSSTSASIQLIEQLAEGKTVIHKLHPLSKLITTIVFTAIVLSFQRYSLSGLVSFAFYPIILMALSETPYRPMIQRLAIVFPFSFFAAAFNLFFEKEVLMNIGIFTISTGMVSFLNIMLKTFLTVAAIFILAATTPISKLSNQLIRFKIPKIIIIQINMTYRYISIFIDECFVMVSAYSLRSPKTKGIHIKDMGVFIGQLLLRSIDRCERIYQVMKCRGFKGSIYCKCEKFCLNDIVYMTIVCFCLLLMRFFNVSTFVGSIL